MNIVRRYRGKSNDNSNELKSTLPLSSDNTSAVKAKLLRRSTSRPPPARLKEPLLSFCLSSPSFLDSTIKESSSSYPLYRIKTSGTSTTVLRRDLTEKSTIVAASIKWPKIIPLKRGKACSEAVLVMMKNGCWSGGDTLLKPGFKDSNSRKFYIPNYSHPMKWKLNGTRYWCTTSPVEGPVATLDPRKGNYPPKLIVYETFHDSSDELSTYRGVSVLLLDYLIVTALLLVTDLQEWMLVPKFEGQTLDATDPGSTLATSDPKWRKIMYGEPIYPKIARSASHVSSPASTTLRATRNDLYRHGSRQAGTSTTELNLPSFIDTRSESDEDSDFEVDTDIHEFPGAMSSTSLAESSTQNSHSEFDLNFYQPPTPVPEPAIPSRPLSPLTPLDSLYPQSPSSESTHFSRKPLSPIPQLPSQESVGDSPIDNLSFDGHIFPRLLPSLPPQQPSTAEVRRRTLSTVRMSAVIAYPRPLPSPLEGSPPIVQASHLRRSVSVSHSIGQYRPVRPLPPTPGSRTQSTSSHDVTPGDNLPEQNNQQRRSRAVYPPPSQLPIRKSSHEDLAQWLQVLTSPEAGTLPSDSLSRLLDAPPPAYSSLGFSASSETGTRTPVSVLRDLPTN